MNKLDLCLLLIKLRKCCKNFFIITQHKIQQEYYSDLEYIHKKIKPKKYLEIGVRNGVSIALADKSTQCIGIDPNPVIKVALSKKTEIFSLTSDDFFSQYSESEMVKNIDLAFIDGMHLFEFVLRDFINTEKCCNKNGVILLHDSVPRDEITSRRERCTDFWTGDVYKMVLILKKYRPDLQIFNLDSKPSGLVLIKNLNSESTVLKKNYDKILEEFMDFEYSEEIYKELDIKSNKVLKDII